MSSTSIKFSGLASGLDTESLVTALVSPYKLKVDSSKQATELLSMKKDVMKDINGKVYNFFNTKLHNMRLEGSFNKSNVTPNVAGVVEIGKGSLPEGSHSLKVTSLAQSANMKTMRVKTTSNTNADKMTTLSELGITNKVTLQVSENGSQAVDIELDGSMTIADVESKLKTALPNSNVSFNNSLGAFGISSKNTGESQSISIGIADETNTNTLTALGFVGVTATTDPTTNKTTTSVSVTGSNTDAEYNGMKIDSETNTITLNGAEVTLVGTGTTGLTSKSNVDDTYNMIVDFVDSYNQLLEEINNLVYAEANKGYDPLTDEQKEAMSEDEIKKWNAKINESILRNDSTLKGVADTMRQCITDAKVQTGTDANGKPIYMTMASIGISTGTNWNERGKLHIDSEKLKAALAENPDAVTQLFAGKENATTGQRDGVATKMYSKLSDKLTKSTTMKSANFLFNDKQLDKNIKSQKEKTNDLIEKMEDMEDLYYARFTAMEKMLTSLNSQSSYFASMLG